MAVNKQKTEVSNNQLANMIEDLAIAVKEGFDRADTDMHELKNRVTGLEDGQERIEDRVGNLEQGQVRIEAKVDKLEVRTARLEEGQEKIVERLTNLEDGQERIKERLSGVVYRSEIEDTNRRVQMIEKHLPLKAA